MMSVLVLEVLAMLMCRARPKCRFTRRQFKGSYHRKLLSHEGQRCLETLAFESQGIVTCVQSPLASSMRVEVTPPLFTLGVLVCITFFRHWLKSPFPAQLCQSLSKRLSFHLFMATGSLFHSRCPSMTDLPACEPSTPCRSDAHQYLIQKRCSTLCPELLSLRMSYTRSIPVRGQVTRSSQWRLHTHEDHRGGLTNTVNGSPGERGSTFLS